MEYRATYEVSRLMQDASIRQYFFSVMLGWRRLVTLSLFSLLAGALIIFDASSGITIFVGSIAVILLTLWVKTYFQVLSQGRTGLHLMEHPNIEVLLADEFVEYRSSTGTRVHRWEKMDRLIETKDFAVLMHGKVPLLSLPKIAFSQEALGFIRCKLP